jgi:tRNA(Ile)-lysidine synthase
MNPVESLLKLAGRNPRIVVAFSGGIDSTVLVHALARQRRLLGALRLVHIDHGLQAASAEWARRCVRQARAWKLPISVLRARIARARGESPEAAAREARYALLAKDLSPGEVLVTAQHRDDQVETLLLQLFRGAGVAGLASMPPIAAIGVGRIARPLLDTSRTEVEAYAGKHRLRWIDDPTNAQQRFARNFLRHEVLPRVRDNWPGVDAAIARSAVHMAEANALLRQSASRDLAAAADGGGLSVARLRALDAAARRNALREFIARAGIELPPATKLREIAGPLLTARPDANPQVRWSNVRIQRHAGRLVLEVISEVSGDSDAQIIPKSWRWTKEREHILNSRGDSLAFVDDENGALDLALLPATLEVRGRAGGEALRPGPRARSQSLKKLLQAATLTLDERAQLPLLFSGKRLLAAGDRWIDASVAANVKSRRRARLDWKKK